MPASRPRAPGPPPTRLSADGRLEVLGTEAHRHEIIALARHAAPGQRLWAVLIPEGRDGLAVQIATAATGPLWVGRLARADATGYRSALASRYAGGGTAGCPAVIEDTPDGSRRVVLWLAPPEELLVEGDPSGLVVLEPRRGVAVCQDDDDRAGPGARLGPGGRRTRRVLAELVPAPLRDPAHAGRSGFEVRVDGLRVAELPPRTAQRYRDVFDEVLARGDRPACEALVRRRGHRPEIELRLPDLVETARESLTGSGPDDDRRPAPAEERTRFVPAVPHAPQRPGRDRPPAPARASAPWTPARSPVGGRRQRLVAAAVGTVAALAVLAMSLTGTGDDDADAAPIALPPGSTPAPTPASTTASTTTPVPDLPDPSRAVEPVGAPVAATPRRAAPPPVVRTTPSVAQPPVPTSTAPPVPEPTRSRPTSRTQPAAPQPPTVPDPPTAPEQEPDPVPAP